MKSNLPPGALPTYVHVEETHCHFTGENMTMNREQMSLLAVEMFIRGELKEALHESGILPLKEKDLTSKAMNMAKVINEAYQKGTDLKAAFIEAGILPQNSKQARRATASTLK